MAFFLDEIIAGHAQHMGNAIALVEDERRLSWRQIESAVRNLSCQLMAAGVGPETIVGVCCKRPSDTVLSMLSIMAAGGTYLPLECLYARDRIHFMVRDAGVKLVLVDSTTEELFGEVAGLNLLRIPASTDLAMVHETTSPVCSLANTAYVIYTSGSTGVPKGVAISYSGLLNLINAQEALFSLTSQDVVLQFASCSFDASIWEVMMAIKAGATLVLGPRSAMAHDEKLRNLIYANRVTVATFPPSILRLLTHEVTPLQTIIVGGEACGNELAERFAGNKRFFNCYGPTEATICATGAQCKPGFPVNIGRPLQNVTVYVVDDNFTRVPTGQVGQICIGGTGVGQGYLNRPALTAEKFVPDPWSNVPGQRLYCTGDLGRYLPDGFLQFEGRMDHQIKIRGLRIEPGEIEETLRNLHWISNAVVITDEVGELKDKVLVAYVETDRPSPGKDELRQYLLKRLPEFMVPTVFLFLKHLPLTINGKIDRKALPAPQPESAPSEIGRAQSATETIVLEIWSTILSTKNVHAESNFFDLGGHSLLANQIIARLQEIFNVDIALPQIFATPTVASLANWIDKETTAARAHQPQAIPAKAMANGNGKKQTSSQVSPLIEFRGTGSNPPLFFVHPGGGEVFCYTELAKHLQPDQPFYAFRCVETEDNTAADSIAAMAQRNIAALREFGMPSPLFLGGWSLGGVIAYEMACQLQHEGEEPAVVLLLDAAVSTLAGELDELAVFREFIRDIERLYQTETLTIPNLEILSEAERLCCLSEKINNAGGPVLQNGLNTLEKAFKRFRINYRAAHNHRPKSYRGNVAFLMTAQEVHRSSDSLFGWNQFFAGESELHVVSGDHYSMLASPFSRELAEKITECLANCKLAKSAHY